MNKRQKIIVSITGIFLVLLILIGLTYAYFLTRIEGNTNTKSISITTADLKLVYRDGSPNIEVENIQPGETVYTKSFTVTNEGNASVTNYQVYLENVVNGLNRKDDLVYTLTCDTNDTVNSPCTNEINSETAYPSVNGTLVQNNIDVGDVHTYTFTLKYKEMNVDQSEDMGKTIGGKFNIYDQNDLNTLTLGYYILSNGAYIQEYQETVNYYEGCLESGESEEVCSYSIYDETDNQYLITDIKSNPNTSSVSPKYENNLSIITDQGIFETVDDYGNSYYYRGAVINNYVKFAGFNWRVVRINGDGSVRIILEDITSQVKQDGSSNVSGSNAKFNDISTDNAYVGFTYGSVGSDNYDSTHDNTNEETTNDSTIKTALDLFYTTYLNNYNDYISDTIFCGDKSLASENMIDENLDSGKWLGYGINKSYYKASERLYYNALTDVAYPTLKCAEGEINTFSRYTVDNQNINGIETNGSLDYPIGLISADEVVYAGTYTVEPNQTFYLHSESNSNYWTMSPGGFIDGNAKVVYVTNGYIGIVNTNVYYPFVGVRPVINIDSDILIRKGNGTIDAPYILN